LTEIYPRKVSQKVWLSFATPPFSANAIWRSFKGRNIKSREYRDWISAAGKELEAQSPGCVPGPFGVRIALANTVRMDCDNAIKPIVDLLRLHNVIEGDSKKYMRKCESGHSELSSVTTVWVISTKGAKNDDSL